MKTYRTFLQEAIGKNVLIKNFLNMMKKLNNADFLIGKEGNKYYWLNFYNAKFDKGAIIVPMEKTKDKTRTILAGEFLDEIDFFITKHKNTKNDNGVETVIFKDGKRSFQAVKIDHIGQEDHNGKKYNNYGIILKQIESKDQEMLFSL